MEGAGAVRRHRDARQTQLDSVVLTMPPQLGLTSSLHSASLCAGFTQQAFRSNSCYSLMPESCVFSIHSRKEDSFSNCPNKTLDLPHWLGSGHLCITSTVTRGGDDAKTQECT